MIIKENNPRILRASETFTAAFPSNIAAATSNPGK